MNIQKNKTPKTFLIYHIYHILMIALKTKKLIPNMAEIMRVGKRVHFINLVVQKKIFH